MFFLGWKLPLFFFRCSTMGGLRSELVSYANAGRVKYTIWSAGPLFMEMMGNNYLIPKLYIVLSLRNNSTKLTFKSNTSNLKSIS